jgi:amino acid permease
MKLIVGAGSFVLPATCAQVGFLGLMICLTFLCLLAFYCTWLMVKLKQEECPMENLSMAEFATRKIGRAAGIVTEICVLGASIGGCAVYLNFCGSVLTKVYCGLPAFIYVLAIGGFVWLFVFLQAFLLVFFRWDPLLFLARSSVVGFGAAILAATLTIVFGAIQNGGVGKKGPYLLIDAAGFPDAFGPVAFLFCVALFMFPISSALDKPRNFNKAAGLGYAVSFVFNGAFATLGYAVFGGSVANIVVNSLVPSTISKVIQVILSLDVFFTFLVVVVPSSIAVRKLLGKISDAFALDPDGEEPAANCKSVFISALAPTLILFLTLILAIFVPGVQSLVGFVSAVGLSWTHLMFPPLCQLVLRRDKNGVFSWIFHIAIMVFGATAGCYTLYSSVNSIITFYRVHGTGGLFSASC